MVLMIILIIVVIITILMITPINLCFDYDGKDLKLWIKYFFIKIQLLPQKPKKEKDKKKKKEKVHKEDEKVEESVKEKEKKRGISEIIDILFDILAFVKDFTKDMRKMFFVKELKIDIVVATGDAYSTAMDFGYACSGIYTIAGILTSFITFNELPDINIKADFNKSETTSKLTFRLCVRPILLIISGIKYIIKAIKLYMGIVNDDNKNSKKKSKKDGVKNGK